MKLKELFEYIDWEQIDYVQINEVDDYKITKYMLASNNLDLISLRFRDLYSISTDDKGLVITIHKGGY